MLEPNRANYPDPRITTIVDTIGKMKKFTERLPTIFTQESWPVEVTIINFPSRIENKLIEDKHSKQDLMQYSLENTPRPRKKGKGARGIHKNLTQLKKQLVTMTAPGTPILE